jgi:hypothetical protein
MDSLGHPAAPDAFTSLFRVAGKIGFAISRVYNVFQMAICCGASRQHALHACKQAAGSLRALQRGLSNNVLWAGGHH